MLLRFALLAAVSLSACAVKVPYLDNDAFYKAYGTPQGRSPDTFMMQGTRLPIVRSGTERDALLDVVDAVAADCATFAESLFWVDCADEPCAVYLAAPVVDFEARAWSEATRHDERLAGFSPLSLTQGGGASLGWLVASPPETDVFVAVSRFGTTWPSERLVPELMRQKGVLFL